MNTYSRLKISKGSVSAAFIAASLFVAPSAMAQKGMWEMSVAGNIENSSTSFNGGAATDQTSTFVAADIGRYFTPKLVGRVSVSMFGSDDGTNNTLGTTAGVGVKYYFGQAAKSKWIPFVQGGVNLVMFSSTGFDAFGAGIVGGGGVSHFLTEEVSIDLAGQVFADSLTVDAPGDPTMENSGLRILFGVTARY